MVLMDRKRQSLLVARDDDEMFMTRSLTVTSKTTEQHLTVRSGKSEAEVQSNNKRVCSSYYTVEANHRQTRSIAQRLCDCRATSLITFGCLLSYSNLVRVYNKCGGCAFIPLQLQ